jgi:hypothetical protein
MTLEKIINDRLVALGYSFTVDEIAYKYGHSALVIGTTEKTLWLNNDYASNFSPVKAWGSFNKSYNIEGSSFFIDSKKPIYLYLNTRGWEYFSEKKDPGLFHNAREGWLQLPSRRLNNQKVQISL